MKIPFWPVFLFATRLLPTDPVDNIGEKMEQHRDKDGDISQNSIHRILIPAKKHTVNYATVATQPLEVLPDVIISSMYILSNVYNI